MNIKRHQPQKVSIQGPLGGKLAGGWAAWSHLGNKLALLAYACCVALCHSPTLSEPLFPNSVNLQNARALEKHLCPQGTYSLVEKIQLRPQLSTWSCITPFLP